MTVGIVTRLKARIRQHLLLQSSSYVLAWLGLEVVPYYLCHEEISSDASGPEPGLKAVEVAILSSTEIDRISLSPESPGLEQEKSQLLREGCVCYGLLEEGEILSYMWCDYRRCRSKLASFRLRDDEVYMFRAVTFSQHRGKNLAPFLRSRVYNLLRQAGRTNLFSITEALNYPAVRFKQKLNAKPLRLGLYLCLFRRYTWNVTLKRYAEREYGRFAAHRRQTRS